MPGLKNFTAGDILTADQMDDYVAKQTVMKFTGTADRNTQTSGVTREGMVAYLDDANSLQVNTSGSTTWSTIGPVHGVLASWTPTVTQSAAIALTVTYARYQRIGRVIHAWARFNITATGTANNVITIGGLPATAAQSGVAVGSGLLQDASASVNYGAVVALYSTTTLAMYYGAQDGFTSGANEPLAPFGGSESFFAAALGSGDMITFQITYEAASDA